MILLTPNLLISSHGTGRGRAWVRALAGALGVLWMTLAVMLASTRAPVSNEAWTAIPAVNLAYHGFMGTTVLEWRNTWLQGLDRHTYWQMPFDFLVQAGWYKIFGFSLVRQRLLSVVCAVGLLAAWSRIVWRVTGMEAAAWLVPVVIGFESTFLLSAANGRMDMLCAALGAAGIWAWVEWREKRPWMALAAGHALCAAAVFTHPCGLVFAVSLVVFQWGLGGFPRERIGLHLACVAAPYLLAAGVWGIYIAAAPSDFRSQFLGNTSGFAGEYLQRGRLNGLANPWRAVLNEVRWRYSVGLQRSWLVVSGVATLWAMASVGPRAQRGVRVLIAAEISVFLLMALFEGMKFPHYLIYSLPFIAAVTAVTAGWLWMRSKSARVAVVACLLTLTVPSVGTVLAVIRTNPLRQETGFVANYLRSHLRVREQAIGGAELGYFLGFDGAVRDDVRLGYYTGLQPRFLVTSNWYRLWYEAAAVRDPAVHAYIERLLNAEYREVLSRGEYRVYERKGL